MQIKQIYEEKKIICAREDKHIIPKIIESHITNAEVSDINNNTFLMKLKNVKESDDIYNLLNGPISIWIKNGLDSNFDPSLLYDILPIDSNTYLLRL